MNSTRGSRWNVVPSKAVSVLLGMIALLASGCTITLRERDIFATPASGIELDRNARVPLGDKRSQPRLVGEPIEVAAADGVMLRGWYIRVPNARRAILFIHGNAGIVRDTGEHLSWIARTLEANVLAVDYRGYGYSDGEPSLDAICSDVVTLHDRLAMLRDSPDQPIFLYGYSLGTAFATWLATQREPAGIILVAPFSTVQEYASSILPFWLDWLIHIEVAPDLAQQTQPVENISKVKAPLLVVHGARDGIIPIRLGRKLFEASPAEYKEFLALPDSGHMRLRMHKLAVISALREFVETASKRWNARVARL